MEKVEIFYYDRFRRKVSFTVPLREFEYHRISMLERTFTEDIGDVYYHYNGITKKLDYYNHENISKHSGNTGSN